MQQLTKETLLALSCTDKKVPLSGRPAGGKESTISLFLSSYNIFYV